MVVAEKPVLEPNRVAYVLEKFGRAVGTELAVETILRRRRRAMRDDKVDLAAAGVEVFVRVREVLLRRHLLGPPRTIRRAPLLVSRLRAAEGEDGDVVDVEHFPANEMAHVVADTVDTAAVPFFDGELEVQAFEVLVVAVHEQHVERLFVEPPEPILLGSILEQAPDNAEVACNDEVIAGARQRNDTTLADLLVAELVDLNGAVRVASDVDGHEEPRGKAVFSFSGTATRIPLSLAFVR